MNKKLDDLIGQKAAEKRGKAGLQQHGSIIRETVPERMREMSSSDKEHAITRQLRRS